MIDTRLEARLRHDPDGDPRHEVGLLWSRAAAVPAMRVRRSPTAARTVSPLALVVVVAMLIGVIGTQVIGPDPTPSTSPTPPASPTPSPILTPSQLAQVVASWQVGAPGAFPLSVTILGPEGQLVSHVEGSLPGSPPATSTARIGEISRLYLIAATARVSECTDATFQSAACSTPPVGPRLALDDAVARWLPGWPDGDPTTVRQLMQGASGVPAIATSLEELADRVAAEPGADWSRATAFASAMAAARRFAPGSRIEPVDTEAMLLEEILAAATGQRTEALLPVSGIEPFTTRPADRPPIALMPGERASGGSGSISDLDPVVLALVGNAGGISASSIDLTYFALTVRRPADFLTTDGVDMLTDRSAGYLAPYGATSSCPCDGSPIVLSVVGNGVGWSALTAYDVTHQTAIGVVAGRGLDRAQMLALLDLLVGALSA